MTEDLHRIARELDLPPSLVTRYYRAYWLYIKTTIESFELKQDIDEDTYNKMRVNFNLPNLGRLACSYRRQQNLRNRFKNKENGDNNKRHNSFNE